MLLSQCCMWSSCGSTECKHVFVNRFLAGLKGVIMLRLHEQRMHLSHVSSDILIHAMWCNCIVHKQQPIRPLPLSQTPILASEGSSVHISHTMTCTQSQTHAVLQQICFILKNHHFVDHRTPNAVHVNAMH